MHFTTEEWTLNSSVRFETKFKDFVTGFNKWLIYLSITQLPFAYKDFPPNTQCHQTHDAYRRLQVGVGPYSGVFVPFDQLWSPDPLKWGYSQSGTEGLHPEKYQKISESYSTASGGLTAGFKQPPHFASGLLSRGPYTTHVIWMNIKCVCLPLQLPVSLWLSTRRWKGSNMLFQLSEYHYNHPSIIAFSPLSLADWGIVSKFDPKFGQIECPLGNNGRNGGWATLPPHQFAQPRNNSTLRGVANRHLHETHSCQNIITWSAMKKRASIYQCRTYHRTHGALCQNLLQQRSRTPK